MIRFSLPVLVLVLVHILLLHSESCELTERLKNPPKLKKRLHAIARSLGSKVRAGEATPPPA